MDSGQVNKPLHVIDKPTRFVARLNKVSLWLCADRAGHPLREGGVSSTPDLMMPQPKSTRRDSWISISSEDPTPPRKKTRLSPHPGDLEQTLVGKGKAADVSSKGYISLSDSDSDTDLGNNEEDSIAAFEHHRYLTSIVDAGIDLATRAMRAERSVHVCTNHRRSDANQRVENHQKLPELLRNLNLRIASHRLPQLPH